jgi:hypothetical protein
MIEHIELIGAVAAITGPLIVIIYRLGAMHADFRRALGAIEDHETRIRALEEGE